MDAVVFPPGAVAKVSIIDNGTRINGMSVGESSQPPIEGHDYVVDGPSWSFLIESPTGRKALFDLGLPKDYHQMAPRITGFIADSGWKLKVEKDVIDILKENGVSGADINSIIWR